MLLRSRSKLVFHSLGSFLLKDGVWGNHFCDPVDLDGSNKFQKLLKYLYTSQTLNSASTNLLYKTYSWEIPFTQCFLLWS